MDPLVQSSLPGFLMEDRLRDNGSATIERRIRIGEVGQQRMQFSLMKSRFRLWLLGLLLLQGFDKCCRQLGLALLEEESGGALANLDELGILVIPNFHVKPGTKC